jgi:hypothetical protein
MPPCRIGRPLWPSGPTILLSLCLMTGLSGAQSVLYWRCHPVEYRCLGCPPSGVLGHPKWVWWHAPHLFRDICWWHVCILICDRCRAGKKLEAREPARARSDSARLGEAREPNSTARYTNEPSRAGSVRLASRLEARSKLLRLSLVSCQFVY